MTNIPEQYISDKYNSDKYQWHIPSDKMIIIQVIMIQQYLLVFMHVISVFTSDSLWCITSDSYDALSEIVLMHCQFMMHQVL